LARLSVKVSAIRKSISRSPVVRNALGGRDFASHWRLDVSEMANLFAVAANASRTCAAALAPRDPRSRRSVLFGAPRVAERERLRACAVVPLPLPHEDVTELVERGHEEGISP